MKAITLWQPWAQAVALGLKHMETRDWPAVCNGGRFRGWLAICAAKTMVNPDTRASLADDLFYICTKSEESARAFADIINWATDRNSARIVFDKLPFGMIVAMVWLELSVPAEELDMAGDIEALELLWGNYVGPERWAWQFTECWRLHTPVPVRGERKLFDVQMPADWQDRASKVF